MGKTFGRLTVIGMIGNRADRVATGVYWSCRCACGSTTQVHGKSLRDGTTSSCGCVGTEKLRQRTTKPKGIAVRNQAVRSVHVSARTRGISVDLTNDQILELFVQPCAYCGSGASNLSRHPDSAGEFAYNGIDRVNNAVGYTIENCVTCCKDCNYAKRDRSADEFRAWIRRCYEHQNVTA